MSRGTILGGGDRTVIVHSSRPRPARSRCWCWSSSWGCYALFRINYALFTVCLTGYVVFILMLSGVAEMTAASLRAMYTIEGGALALIVYARLADVGLADGAGVAGGNARRARRVRGGAARGAFAIRG